MQNRIISSKIRIFCLVVVFILMTVVVTVNAASEIPNVSPDPIFSSAIAFDVSPAVRDLEQPAAIQKVQLGDEPIDIRPDRGPVSEDRGFSGDGAIQEARFALENDTPTIPDPLENFEGLSNEDNRAAYGFRVAPPDPVGDVGPNHYVEMINLVFAVYDKQGNMI